MHHRADEYNLTFYSALKGGVRSVPGEAIKILWLQYHPSLLRIAFRLTHDEEAAKDVVQEAFSHVWTNASKLHSLNVKFIDPGQETIQSGGKRLPLIYLH